MQVATIFGPPGTGKTTACLNIIEELLERGVSPREIAFVSFTRKAANEARDRAIQRFPHLEPKDFDNFRTLHSLAFRMLGLSRGEVMADQQWREFGKETGLDFSAGGEMYDGLPVFTGNDAMWIQLYHHMRATLRDPDGYWHALSREEIMEVDKRVRTKGGLATFKRICKKVVEYKEKHGLMDFSDMLERAARYTAEDARYVIVDEAQDLSPLQWRFYDGAFRGVQEAWFAGDDDQAIFEWAGASPADFLERSKRGHVRVLGQSYRCPEAVWHVANGIINEVAYRQPKDWAPRGEPGDAEYLYNDHPLLGVPLHEGEWLLLTRTHAQQRQLMEHLRADGYPYVTQHGHSVKPSHVRAAKAWTALLKGDVVTASAAGSVYDLLRTREQVKRGGKAALAKLDPDRRLNMVELQRDYGLLAGAGEWYDVLTLPSADAGYYRAIRRRGESLSSERIRISTIHAVKGGECDNVFLLGNMGAIAHGKRFQREAMDAERRVFYVGATRARRRLYVHNRGTYLFPFPRPRLLH